jgi:hypothetical protein
MNGGFVEPAYDGLVLRTYRWTKYKINHVK